MASLMEVLKAKAERIESTRAPAVARPDVQAPKLGADRSQEPHAARRALLGKRPSVELVEAGGEAGDPGAFKILVDQEAEKLAQIYLAAGELRSSAVRHPRQKDAK